PRISDREIIEKLAKLEAGQEALSVRLSDLRAEMKSDQEALRAEMKAGQEALRAEMKAGQEALGKRMDDSNSTMLVFFSSIITLIVALFGYIAWDRRTMVKPVIDKVDRLEREILNDLDFHHNDGSLLRRQLRVLREYSRKNPEFAEIMRGAELI
ncbi:hypothetical protein, partial [Desulfamplus magnetovallimortis]|uniref:hypothetical protein n=1 Tax=Desulfamplus magnetovallimortis TaxID=1246637 RepID=UPI001C97BF03